MKGYMTLGEASEKWGITARQLNTYCLKDQIPGVERAGRVWLIPENASKPIDSRVTTGEYKDWRKKYGKNKEKTKLKTKQEM